MAVRLASKPGRGKQPVGEDLRIGLPETQDRKREGFYVFSY